MEKIIENRKKFIINFIYFAICVGVYFVVVKYALGYIYPFAIAVALAVFLQPAIRKITSKLHLKTHGVVSIILVLLIVVAILGAFAGAIFLISNELKDLFSHLFSRFTSMGDLIDSVRGFILNIIKSLPGKLEMTVSGYVNNFFNNLSNGETTPLDLSVFSTPLSGAWNVVKSIPTFMLSILVTVISSVFVTAEYNDIRDMILGMCTEEKGRKLIAAKNTITKGVGKLIKAYVTIMFITFVEVFLGLNLMKILGVYDGGYIAIIAFVTCIVDIVPVLGTGTVVIPWAIYSFFNGNFGFGVGLLVLYAVITVIRQITEPKLVANQVGLPSVITIMAMFIGARVFGAFGIIILPLTIIVLKLMYDEGIIGNKVLLGNKELFVRNKKKGGGKNSV